jgi:hypothetical protein
MGCMLNESNISYMQVGPAHAEVKILGLEE